MANAPHHDRAIDARRNRAVNTPYRFGPLAKAERRALRLVVHDGASIAELLVFLLVTCSHAEIEVVAPFLGLTQKRGNDLLRSVTRRIESNREQREHDEMVEHFATSQRRSKHGKRERTVKEMV